jgi:plastocyanin
MTQKIKVPNGGTVSPGEGFDWENQSGVAVSITGTGSFLTLSSYNVPAKGTTTAQVQNPCPAGEYTYSESNNTTGTNPKMTVT